MEESRWRVLPGDREQEWGHDSSANSLTQAACPTCLERKEGASRGQGGRGAVLEQLCLCQEGQAAHWCVLSDWELSAFLPLGGYALTAGLIQD